MSCGCGQTGMGCGCGQYGYSLMGAIEPGLEPITGGTPFQFGYNIGYTLNPFNPNDVAKLLQEDLALSYDTHSYRVAGHLNPFTTVEGYAVTTWPSASQFAEEIYSAISGAGFPIDYSSIQFRFFPEPGSAAPSAPPRLVGTPYQTPNAQSPSVPHAPDGTCSFSQQNLPDYLACQLGVTPTVALVAGAIGALILVVAIKR